MPSHSEGPEIWLSVRRFHLTHCLYERAVEVLVRLCGCSGSPDFAARISDKFQIRLTQPSCGILSLLWGIGSFLAFRTLASVVLSSDMGRVRRKPVLAICEQRRRKSAFTSTQSDQRLCCSLPRWYMYIISSCYIRNFKPLASFCGCAGRFESYLVKNSEGRFSGDEAHIVVSIVWNLELTGISTRNCFFIQYERQQVNNIMSLITRKPVFGGLRPE